MWCSDVMWCMLVMRISKFVCVDVSYVHVCMLVSQSMWHYFVHSPQRPYSHLSCMYGAFSEHIHSFKRSRHTECTAGPGYALCWVHFDTCTKIIILLYFDTCTKNDIKRKKKCISNRTTCHNALCVRTYLDTYSATVSWGLQGRKCCPSLEGCPKNMIQQIYVVWWRWMGASV